MNHLVLQTPSLQHLSGVKIVTCLWNHHRVMAEIERANNLPLIQVRVESMENVVKSNLSALPLPPLLRKHLARFIRPIGHEILNWCDFHSGDGKVDASARHTPFPKQFRWTMHGTVDTAKTASLMAKDETLDIVQRYLLACVHCLEAEARELRLLIPKNQIWPLLDAIGKSCKRFGNCLVAFFTYTLCDWQDLLQLYFSEDLQNASIEQYLFKSSVNSGLRPSSEYFFAKLKQEEKEEALSLSAFWYANGQGNFLYYWSIMSEELREVVYRHCTLELLDDLLRWPMQFLFVETAKRAGQFMNDSQYDGLLWEIGSSMGGRFNYNCDVGLFCQLWELSPATCKRHFFDDDDRLEILLKTKDEEVVRLVLNEAPSRQIRALCDKDAREVAELLSEDVVSEAALTMCEERAAKISSDDGEDEEKRTRSQYFSQLVDRVMQIRVNAKRR